MWFRIAVNFGVLEEVKGRRPVDDRFMTLVEPDRMLILYVPPPCVLIEGFESANQSRRPLAKVCELSSRNEARYFPTSVPISLSR
jgi:hypothetical protein